eukprot:2700424-Rhodomonas_salina.1
MVSDGSGDNRDQGGIQTGRCCVHEAVSGNINADPTPSLTYHRQCFPLHSDIRSNLLSEALEV